MNARDIREQRLEELRQLRERQRAQKPETLRSFTEAEEAREREARERPIREAEAALQATAREFGAMMREKVTNGKDPEFAISPELTGARMSIEQAKQFNLEQVREFMESTPEYAGYRTPENAAAIYDYLHRNGCEIAGVHELRQAFLRLLDFGLLTPKPEPEPEPVQSIPETPIEEPKRDDGSMEGFDLESGEPRRYSAREIQRMSSEEMKRAFRIYAEQQILARRF